MWAGEEAKEQAETALEIGRMEKRESLKYSHAKS